MVLYFLSTLFSFGANYCALKPYDPGPKPPFLQLCQAPDKRGPASVRPLEPVEKRLSKDPLNRFTPSQRRMFRALETQDFRNLDLNNNGKANIDVRKDSKGYKKVKLSFRGDGKFNQISLYSPQGKLIKEQVDHDMDGQVDYLYECKDQVCETRTDFESGQANKVMRYTVQGNQETYTFYERTNGQLALVNTTTSPIKKIDYVNNPAVMDHRTAGSVCTNCDETLSEFAKLLDFMKQQHEIVNFNQEELGDFVTTRLGIMIHKNCFDKYADGSPRWDFDVVEAVDNSLVKGMSCLAEGEEYYSNPEVAKRRKQPGTSTKYSIFPQFLKYMDKDLWDKNQYPFTPTENGIYSFDSCEKMKADPFYKNNFKNDCEIVQEHANRPKVFCEEDVSFLHLVEYAESERKASSLNNSSAYATIGGNEPMIVNHHNTTRVYNGPGIVFKKPHTKNMSKGKFESVLFHEMFHNLGYVHQHDDDNLSHNDYATLCEATCFRDAHEGRVTTSAAEAADGYCFDYKPNKDAQGIAHRLRRIMGGTK